MPLASSLNIDKPIVSFSLLSYCKLTLKEIETLQIVTNANKIANKDATVSVVSH